MKRNTILVIVVLMSLAILTAACAAPTPAPVYAEGAEKDQVVAKVAPFAQDILDGIRKNDYATFVKDFDAATAKAMTPDTFNTIVASLAKLGAYQSHEADTVQIVDKFYSVTYNVAYEKGSFTMRVVVPKEGTPAVTGLWFK